MANPFGRTRPGLGTFPHPGPGQIALLRVAAIAESRAQVEGQACDQDERECRDNGCNQRGNRSERDKAANEEAGRKTVEAPAAAPSRLFAARGRGLPGGYEPEAETDKRNDKRYESGSDGDVEPVSEADQYDEDPGRD